MTNDELALRVAANVISDFLKLTTSGIHKLISRVASQGRAEDIFGTAAGKYARLLLERHSKMKILGMTKPVQLADLYTDVHLLQKIPSRQRAEAAGLSQFLETETGIFQPGIPTVPAVEAVDANDRLVVLGKPGAGKTTLLRHIVMRDIQNQDGLGRLPMFVALHEVVNRDVTITESIARDLADAGIDEPKFLEHLMQTGKAMVLLDGLDEVGPEKTAQIVQEIVDMCAKYPRNKYVVTCRTAVYSAWLQSFTDVEIADFAPNQIKTFICNWFADTPERGEACWSDLCDRPSIFQLATTPLLLALVCISYEDHSAIADTRADLYKDAIDVLLRKWDSTRLIRREQRYRALSPSSKETMLSFLAAQMFYDERYFFTYEAARDAICNFVLHLEDINEDEAREDAAAMLTAIEGHHGIVVTRAKDVYSFAHLTFQEYFTAVFLAKSEQNLRDKIIDEHLADTRWREVLILVAHMLTSADEYVVSILRKLVKLGIDGSSYRGLVQQQELLRNREPSIGAMFQEPRGMRPIMACSEDRETAKRILERILNIAPWPKLLLISVRDTLVQSLNGRTISITTSYERPLTDEEKQVAHPFWADGSRGVRTYGRTNGEFPDDLPKTEQIIDEVLSLVRSFGYDYIDLNLPISPNTIKRAFENLMEWNDTLTHEAVSQLDSALPEHVSFYVAIKEAKSAFDTAYARWQAHVDTNESRAEHIKEIQKLYKKLRKRILLQNKTLKNSLETNDKEQARFERLLAGRVADVERLRYRPPTNLLRGSAVLAEILSTPVYLRKETRRAALATLKAFPFEDPTAPRGGPAPASSMSVASRA